MAVKVDIPIRLEVGAELLRPRLPTLTRLVAPASLRQVAEDGARVASSPAMIDAPRFRCGATMQATAEEFARLVTKAPPVRAAGAELEVVASLVDTTRGPADRLANRIAYAVSIPEGACRRRGTDA